MLRYPDAFGLKFGSDAVFPAELWDIEPGQRYTRKLDPDQTQKFLKASTKFPEQRLREIMEAVRPAGVSNASPSIPCFLHPTVLINSSHSPTIRLDTCRTPDYKWLRSRYKSTHECSRCLPSSLAAGCSLW